MTTEQKNLKAFLIMIQYSEGTYGKDAYRKLYGGGVFNDFSKHPDTPITKYGITSTAAGAYQILFRTWQELQQKLRLPDFSPESQDKAAIELIKRRRALDDVMAGRFAQAIIKCRKEWASLPGAGYNQTEKDPKALAAVYKLAGGNIAA
ncbi:MAG TPA: glycoside hydrolase family 104 protein [Chitinophagaceae bacterium]|nr:glycoside hydrolase family 104 protein [Chitinophagaceae bacterium]